MWAGVAVTPKVGLLNPPPLQQAVPSLLEVKQRNLRVYPQVPKEERRWGEGREGT